MEGEEEVEGRWEDGDEEGGLVEVEMADEGTRWAAGGTASPLIVTTDPPAPRNSVGPPPCYLMTE